MSRRGCFTAARWLLFCCGASGCAMDFDSAFSGTGGVDGGADSRLSDVSPEAREPSDGPPVLDVDSAPTEAAVDVRHDQVEDAPRPDHTDAQDLPDVIAVDSPPVFDVAPTLTDCNTYCAASCKSSVPGNETGDCAACVKQLCSEAQLRFNQNPSGQEVLDCLGSCPFGDAGCLTTCCILNKTACLAYGVLAGCRCGYKNTSCAGTCELACHGGGFDSTCTSCVEDSPCGGLYYDYITDETREAYSICRGACDGGADCEGDCCSSHQSACDRRKALVECVCKGSD